MIPFLVPRRPDNGRRDALWEFVQGFWADKLPEAKMVEGDHLDGPFNRGAAINRAAEAAGDWDVAVIADADVVTDPERVLHAVALARETGRVCLPYSRYVGLGEPMTNRILAGYDGDWTPGKRLTMDTHISSLIAIHRDLWETVRGFDERFAGWGYDDIAFIEACRVLGGGIDRMPGTVWHLWHPASPETTGWRKLAQPHQRASARLANRYHAAIDPNDMRRLMQERDEPDGVCLVVLTHGRRDCIATTITSALPRLQGLPITRRIISDDSGDPEYQAWLRLHVPAFDLIAAGKQGGFAANVRQGWEAALGSGQRWIFWLEDDFTFNRNVPLDAMAAVLDSDPSIMQMALRRQAWFPAEIEAGGVIERDPEAYLDCGNRHGDWLEHTKFWTTNPHLIRRSTLAEYEWPNERHSETTFARRILRDGRVSGYWGKRTDKPWVTHFGERTGKGY